MHVRVLSDAQIAKIHDASVQILCGTGFILPHQDARCSLADKGATIDHKAQRVYLPEKLIHQSLESCGRKFNIYGRDESACASFGSGLRNYNSIAGEAFWVDRIGEKRRQAVLADVSHAARFVDKLSNVNIAGAMTDPSDVPVQTRCIEVFSALLSSTIKPVTFWFFDRKSARYIVEMCITTRGTEDKARDKPLCYPLLEPISPLRFPFHGVDLLFETARLNMPVHIGPMAQMGASAPMSIAGTLALENAEILAGVCVTQAIQEGMPVCYGGICHAFDMATTQMIFGGPEQAIFGVAMTEMGKHYGLPVYINVGLTDSKRPDAQAGLEIGATLILGAAAGADIFGHLGICGVDQASSFDILVLQNEIIDYVESVQRNMDVTDALLGIDVVDSVGPGGSFLDSDHTAENFRDQLWFPKILDREFYETWRRNGAKSIAEKCMDIKADVLSAPAAEPMSHTVVKELNDIISASRRELIP